jgi:Ras-related protein Rab-11A
MIYSIIKTNLLLRFTRNEFRLQTKTTIGVEFAYKPLIIEGKKIQNQIWVSFILFRSNLLFLLFQDTAGEERFRSVIPQLYRNSDGVLVVFDLTQPQTLENATTWIEEVYGNTKPDLPIILIGNKSDLVKEPNTLRDQAIALAKQLNVSYMETSAMNAMNVEKAFTTLVTTIYHKKKSKSVNSSVLPTSRTGEPIETVPIVSEPTIKLGSFPRLDDDDNEPPVPKKPGCC